MTISMQENIFKSPLTKDPVSTVAVAFEHIQYPSEQYDTLIQPLTYI